MRSNLTWKQGDGIVFGARDLSWKRSDGIVFGPRDLTWKQSDDIFFGVRDLTWKQIDGIVFGPRDLTWKQSDGIVFGPRDLSRRQRDGIICGRKGGTTGKRANAIVFGSADLSWKRDDAIVFGSSPGREQRASYSSYNPRKQEPPQSKQQPPQSSVPYRQPLRTPARTFTPRANANTTTMIRGVSNPYDLSNIVLVTPPTPSPTTPPTPSPTHLTTPSPAHLPSKPAPSSQPASTASRVVSVATPAMPKSVTPALVSKLKPAPIKRLPSKLAREPSSKTAPRVQRALDVTDRLPVTTPVLPEPVSIAPDHKTPKSPPEPDSGRLREARNQQQSPPQNPPIPTKDRAQVDAALMDEISQLRQALHASENRARVKRQEQKEHEKELKKEHESKVRALSRQYAAERHAISLRSEISMSHMEGNIEKLKMDYSRVKAENDALRNEKKDILELPPPVITRTHQEPEITSSEEQVAKEKRAGVRQDYALLRNSFGRTNVLSWLGESVEPQLKLYKAEANYWEQAATNLDSFVSNIRSHAQLQIKQAKQRATAGSASEANMADEIQLLEVRSKHTSGILNTLATDLHSRATASKTAYEAATDTVWAFNHHTWPEWSRESHNVREYIRELRSQIRCRGQLPIRLINISMNQVVQQLRLVSDRLSRQIEWADRQVTGKVGDEHWKDRRFLLECTNAMRLARRMNIVNNERTKARWLQKQSLATTNAQRIMSPLLTELNNLRATLESVGPRSLTSMTDGARFVILAKVDDLAELTYKTAMSAQRGGQRKEATAETAKFVRHVVSESLRLILKVRDVARTPLKLNEMAFQCETALMDGRRFPMVNPTDKPLMIRATPLKVQTTGLGQDDNNNRTTVTNHPSTFDSPTGTRFGKSVTPSTTQATVVDNDEVLEVTDTAFTFDRPVVQDTTSSQNQMVTDQPGLWSLHAPADPDLTIVNVANDSMQEEKRPSPLKDITTGQPAQVSRKNSSPDYRPSEKLARARGRARPLRTRLDGQPRRLELPKPAFRWQRTRSLCTRARGSLGASWSADISDEIPLTEDWNDARKTLPSNETSHSSEVPLADTSKSSGRPLELSMKDDSANPSLHNQREIHVPLQFQIPPSAFDKALLASNTSAAAFWKHSMYRGPGNETIKIHYCKRYDQAEKQAKLFLEEKVLGFDMEWEPRAKHHTIKEAVSLIQIASESRIALFQIAAFQGSSAQELMPPSLRAILESRSITKAGVNIAGDFTRLQRHLGINGQGLFELSHLYKIVMFSETNPGKVNRKPVSMANHVQHVLHLPLEKGAVRMSAWSRSLTQEQINYAADDAYAGFRVFDALEERRKSMTPTPPRPAFFEDKMPLLFGDGSEAPKTSKSLKTAPSHSGSDSLEPGIDGDI